MAAASSGAAAAAVAAGTTVDLSDVSDPTISMLWRRIYSHFMSKTVGQGMAVCKAFKQLLPPLVTHIDLPADWPSRAAAQKAMQHVAATFTQLEELEISAEYSDDQPKLDFASVSLPCLTRLTLRCQPLRSLHFTSTNTPKLESINLDQCGEIGGFNLELPELQRLFMEHVEVQDEAGFGSSLSACPKLEMVNCYKLWGLGGTLHELRLPKCRELSFYRSDDLEGLKLWAPKLTELELRACYSLECVRIMEDPPGSPLTPLRVNLVNANIDPLSKRHLKQHPRIKAPGGKLITKERDDPRAMWGLGEGDIGSDEDEDEDEDDDDDDDGMGFGFMGGLPGMMVGGGGADAGFVPMMHPLLQMMMGGAGNVVGPDGQLHPAIAQMMMHEGLMHEGEEDPFGSGDEQDDEDEEEWETDEDAVERELEQREAQRPEPDDEREHEANERDEDEDDEDEDEEEEELSPAEMLAAMMMSGLSPGMAAAHLVAAMQGEEVDEVSEGGDGGSGSPQCVIEEVD